MKGTPIVKAPTHITGPDGTRCLKGEEIPPGWFDELPDLQQHLDNLSPTSDVAATAEATTQVSATMRLKRDRGQS